MCVLKNFIFQAHISELWNVITVINFLHIQPKIYPNMGIKMANTKPLEMTIPTR